LTGGGRKKRRGTWCEKGNSRKETIARRKEENQRRESKCKHKGRFVATNLNVKKKTQNKQRRSVFARLYHRKKEGKGKCGEKRQ